ncbi:MAG: hypothetical protein AB7O66_05410 [Limisphaerales bacterium]
MAGGLNAWIAKPWNRPRPVGALPGGLRVGGLAGWIPRALVMFGALATLGVDGDGVPGGDPGADGTYGTDGTGQANEMAMGIAESEARPISLSLWDTSSTLRSWAGFRDNPQLSSVTPVGSAFLAAGGEILVFRLPVDGWEVAIFGLLEHLEYLEPGVAPETTAVVDARVDRKWGDGWFWGAGLDYFFLKQVFDASELAGVRVIIPTVGHTLTFRPRLGREFSKTWRWELEPELSRQWLGEPLDSFLDAGARVQLIRRWGTRSEAGISYRFRDRAFDNRPPRNPDGDVLPGKLEYLQNEWEAVWKATWDGRSRWRTQVRGGYLRSDDLEGGYFDFERFHLFGQIRYSAAAWEVRAEARARWYHYPSQPSSEPDGSSRRRLDLTFLVRGEWKMSRRWRVFVQYEDEMSDENTTAADYRAAGISGGVEFEM